MSFGAALGAFLRERCGSQPRALTFATASWPLAVALRRPPDEIAREIRDALHDAFPGTTMMLPAFTKGFGEDGLCDLDSTPATTGLINEFFRTSPGFRRTCSAFFSFAVSGPDADELVAMRPAHAWGDGSIYRWMFDHDADLVTIGLHPTHGSFPHHAEWRMKVPYRFNKTFAGRIRLRGVVEQLEETLFVRQRDPTPRNDFTGTLPALLARGMADVQIDGIRVSHVKARTMNALIEELLARDPLALVKNAEEFIDA